VSSRRVPKGVKLTSLELHDSAFSGGVTVRLKQRAHGYAACAPMVRHAACRGIQFT